MEGSIGNSKKGIGKTMEPQNNARESQRPLRAEGWESNAVVAALCDMGVSSWNRYRISVVGGAHGRVLEVGVGTGMNLPYYSREIERLTGLDPDAALLRQARKRATKLGRQVALYQGRAEALPFPDESFDTVVGTLVFCSVRDAQAGLKEILRVLKPGGEYRFLEHVRSETPWAARVQDWITPLWRRCTGGCHPNRDTAQAIRDAGFDLIELQRVSVGISPVRPTILGVAIKPAMKTAESFKRSYEGGEVGG